MLAVFYLGRFLQLVGLGIAGLGCLLAFDSDMSERTMWMFCIIGVVAFYAGHFLMPKE